MRMSQFAKATSSLIATLVVGVLLLVAPSANALAGHGHHGHAAHDAHSGHGTAAPNSYIAQAAGTGTAAHSNARNRVHCPVTLSQTHCHQCLGKWVINVSLPRDREDEVTQSRGANFSAVNDLLRDTFDILHAAGGLHAPPDWVIALQTHLTQRRLKLFGRFRI